ncbi:uncharacterized protein KY384_006483 [Bacidia gigantensis]|uniref:uncharacterized protein n=1 Tax=Bacidia gigantensis TaxID=2732470 RepID=UPI001D045CB1|nr:uncharacterized protein KY384_006483 [Bacidia gigantensis]KAG8528795.1 hypothetical protein KY384_006483 [Bacidia gigantensis]
MPTSPSDPETRKEPSKAAGRPAALVQFECPDCGIPSYCSEEHWADDYESHMEICDTLRQINEDEHDLRSGRFFPEFEYPGPQMEEFLVNMSNWDTYLYSREYRAIDDERSLRQVTRMLTYPLTIGSILSELSPYTLSKDKRITYEGLRSLSALRYHLHQPKRGEDNTVSGLKVAPPPMRIFVIGARAESSLPRDVWEQLPLLFNQRASFHVILIGPESMANRDAEFPLPERSPSNPFGAIVEGGLGPHLKIRYTEWDMERDRKWVEDRVKGEMDILMTPGENKFRSLRWDLNDLDPTDVSCGNWGVWAFRGKRSPIHFLPHSPPAHAPSLNYKHINWHRYAYSLYATDTAHLCNAVMVFEALSRYGSKADRLLFYPEENGWDTDIADPNDRDSQLLVKAREWYNVHLLPTEVGNLTYAPNQSQDERVKLRPDAHANRWEGGLMKFLAWGQTQYERILHLDGDMTLLQHLDELFLLPKAPVAMMRAYWMMPEQQKLTSLLVLLQPSEKEYLRLIDAAQPAKRPPGHYDMEILNRFYGDSALVLPHRGYGVLSGEFRKSEHRTFLGNDEGSWDAQQITQEGAKLVHFSDFPLPKPWIMWPHLLIGEIMPKCKYKETGIVDNCKDREVWMGLYDDFRKRRKEICALLSAPAPDWPVKNATAKDDE